MRLKDSVTVITGAGSKGIGRAIAHAYAREGAVVFICGRTMASLESAASEIKGKVPGARVTTAQVDITDAEQVDDFAQMVIDECGRVDVLVNNAGILLRKPFLETTEEEMDRIYEVNVKGQILCTQAFAKDMIKKQRGKVIMLSSEVAAAGLSGISIYGCSKGAISALTRHLAIELAPHNILVNAIAPGAVETDMSRRNLANPEWREKVKNRFPLGRFAQPDEMAGLAVYLGSNESDWVTGQTFYIDGGFTAG